MPGMNLALLPRLRGLTSSLDRSYRKEKLHTRIVVLGASKVGKTAIVEQFLYNKFPLSHRETVEQLHNIEFPIPRIGSLVLEILDTSGTHEFPVMLQLAIKSGDAFILCFAMDDTNSFEEIRRLRDLVIQMKNSSSIPIVVAANKCDLANSVGGELAETITCIDWEAGYVQCSAKENKGVIKIFQELMVQAKVPDVGPAIAKRKPRRKSLPAYPTSSKSEKKEPKRNSCTVS